MLTQRTSFLREETLSGRNKQARKGLPTEWSTAKLPYSLPERKALALKMILDEMPVFIGKQELIVGTRTLLTPHDDNHDDHDVFSYRPACGVPYVNQEDIALFGEDQSYLNKTHYTPDFSILLEKGVGGILQSVETRLGDPTLSEDQVCFLKSVAIAYQGLQNLLLRYAEHAADLAEKETDPIQEQEYRTIETNCRVVSQDPPKNFVQAVQLLYMGHLVSIIESFEFICFGRLDVLLNPYVTQESDEEIEQILACLLLKMYDQTDLVDTYLNKYAAQMVATLGGVLENGESAVSRVTMLFLEAIDQVRLPDPEFNLRISSKNPRAFIERAAELTVTGCNFISYYNDDQFVQNLIDAGIKPQWARCYAFDLCQDINIPGVGEYFVSASLPMANLLMELLLKNHDYSTFEVLYEDYKAYLAAQIKDQITCFNQAHTAMLTYRDGDKEAFFEKVKQNQAPIDWGGRSLMSPLPYLSGLYHGCIETAFDLTQEGYEDKNKGAFLGTATECVNALAAIKKVVYEQRQFSLKDVVAACKHNYEGAELLRKTLWNAPKWGNDDDEVDGIAKDILEFGLREIMKYETVSGGKHLAGIHQAHPVTTGKGLMATPEGRKAWTPTAVTLTPQSGTMQQGPTAALRSGTKIDAKLVQWNYCIMVNYFASNFEGNQGAQIFMDLLDGYFVEGGLQHQPNVLDVRELERAQLEPAHYKDLIVRLWGVSAHFVDLPLSLQTEMIERFRA